MPDCYYGWILEYGEAVVRVSGQTQAAYADFRPNAAKRHLSEESSKGSQEQPAELPSDSLGEKSLAHHKYKRLSQLPPLLIEVGPYCKLLREARDVFVDGHFYACVAMCGISLERFQRARLSRMVLRGNTKSGKSEICCKRIGSSRREHSPCARAWQTCGTSTLMDMG